MKVSTSLLKSIWLFAVVILVFVGRGLPVWLLIVFVVLLPGLPLLREISRKHGLDERQLYIGRFTSHVAFYVFIILILLIIIREFISKGENPANMWYMLLIVPLIVKLYISLFQNYGAVTGARLVCYFFGAVWLLFVLLSHGFSLGTLIESSPFLLIIGLAWLAGRQPLIAGIVLFLLSIGLLFFFGGWARMDIYGRLLMYALIPLPLAGSGVALILNSKFWEQKNETV